MSDRSDVAGGPDRGIGARWHDTLSWVAYLLLLPSPILHGIQRSLVAGDDSQRRQVGRYTLARVNLASHGRVVGLGI